MENQPEETHRCELLHRLRQKADVSWRDQLNEWPTDMLIALDKFYREHEKIDLVAYLLGLPCEVMA